jgi:hypothetical protein
MIQKISNRNKTLELMNGGAASPGPAVTPHKGSDRLSKTLNSLMEFQKKGFFTVDEIRFMVFKEFGCAPPSKNANSPHAPDNIQKIHQRNAVARLHLHAPDNIQKIHQRNAVARLHFGVVDKPKLATPKRRAPDNVEEPCAKKQKCGDELQIMRDLVKNTTRRRFFDECCNKVSPLWHETKGGRQQIHGILFRRAAQDVEDLLYRNHPGPLRKALPADLRKQIHWQVGRDRNNWAGRKPVRLPYVGDRLQYDFQSAYEEIKQAVANAVDLSMDDVKVAETNVVPKVDNANIVPKVDNANVVPKVEAKVTTIRKAVRTCLLCRVSVWTGKAASCPHGLQIAHPKETDWETSPGDPYCEPCWKKEEEFLQPMSQQHRAVGPKRKQIVVAQANAIAEAIASTTTMLPPPAVQVPSKKDVKKKKSRKKKSSKKKSSKKKSSKKKKTKQLGGVRKLLEPAKVKRWQVRFCLPDPNPNNLTLCLAQVGDSVNAKYKGRYYGAFITCVHSEKACDKGNGLTYDVYFNEDPDCPGHKIPHKDIKLPIQTPRQKQFSTWNKYLGKVFYDAGTKIGEDPKNPDYSLEKGEWVVDHVSGDNNFLCCRVGTEYHEEDNTVFDIGYVMIRIRKYEEE